MNRADCSSEKVSSRFIGFMILPIAIFMAVIVNIALPILGLILAAPLLIFSGVLIVAPESRICRLISRRPQEEKNAPTN